jgi:hypothetical protein
MELMMMIITTIIIIIIIIIIIDVAILSSYSLHNTMTEKLQKYAELTGI